MKNVAILAASAGTLSLLCTMGSAQSAADQPPLASPLTFNEAISIALEEQPGTIAEIALERSNGDVVIDIEVINEVGDEVEFHLDPATGEILSSWTDDDPGDDPGETDDADADG
ncbi:PepSY domain-containing protein [Ruegeria sp. 2205SS24-7]|uniref:PepSY domain-containing protein n=1 Tax=Ruegeria discodermiae TaxID=3064389 RepID=UPI002741E031|nr:PepSY domain-containing protein [Ruegeria sp. 2205SS24-7]MDP5218127.1 PepSY domain-containing protein [Ruegeria sp. 2205SS24-7]